MDAAPAEVYNSPPILYIFSALSAMAIVVAILRWLWLMRDDDQSIGGLKFYILWGQVYIVLAVTLLSFFLTLDVFLFSGEGLEGGTIIPETTILLGAGYFFIRHYKRQGISAMRGIFLELRKVFLWVFASLVGWGLSFSLGFCIYYLVVFLSRNGTDFFLFALMVTGFLWNAPTLWLHWYLVRKHPQAKTLKGLKSYNLLVPVACSYLILMVPLAIQEAANSPEFKNLKNEKIIRKV